MPIFKHIVLEHWKLWQIMLFSYVIQTIITIALIWITIKIISKKLNKKKEKIFKNICKGSKKIVEIASQCKEKKERKRHLKSILEIDKHKKPKEKKKSSKCYHKKRKGIKKWLTNKNK